jgi:serine/threonine protein kinase
MMAFWKKDPSQKDVVRDVAPGGEPDADVAQLIPRPYRDGAAPDRRAMSFSIGAPARDPDETVEFSRNEPQIPLPPQPAEHEPPSHVLPVGSRLFEYRLEQVLGQGGFGITYLAMDTLLQERVAIKEYLPNELALRDGTNMVRPKSEDDAAVFRWGLEAFLNEARTITHFRHPNLMRVRRFFEANGTGYIVMDFEAGLSFEHWARRGAVSDAALRRLLLLLLDGLEVVHEAGVLHRDIKPSNIIVRPDGSPVLIDFGAAREFRTRLSRNLAAIVTAGYAPLEQYSSAGPQGPWTDLYGLGAVAYRAVSGTAPPEAVLRLRRDPMVPAVEAGKDRFGADLLQAIDWALAPDERDRPQTAAALRDVLLGKTAAPVLRQPVGAARHAFDDAGAAAPRRTFSRLIPAAVGTLMVLLGGGAIGYLELQPRATTEPPPEARQSLAPPAHHVSAPPKIAVANTKTAAAQDRQLRHREAAEYRKARGNLQQLQAYVSGCKICAFADQARHEIASLQARAALTQREATQYRKARGNLRQLQAYVSGCKICAFADQARHEIASLQARAALTQREAAQYRKARGNLQQLQAYVSGCKICAFADQARHEIASLQARAALTQREATQYRKARGNLRQLQAYVSGCKICAFADQARHEIASLQAQAALAQREATQYYHARGHLRRLQSYLLECNVCAYANKAQEQIAALQAQAAAQRDESQYRNARGNLQKLQAYVSTCTICTFAPAARQEIDAMQEAQALMKAARQQADRERAVRKRAERARVLAAERYAPPHGSYTRSCVNARITGDTLIALCRRRPQDGGDGSWGLSSLPNVRSCAGDIGNDDGQLVCKAR